MLENNNLKDNWYVISVFSGKEQKVKDNLIKKFEAEPENVKTLLKDIKIVTRTELNSKTKKLKSKNLYPSYVFINVTLTDHIWYLIRNTNDVMGFLGSSGGGTKPKPLSKKEIDKMLSQIMYEDKGTPSHQVNFVVGDHVCVKLGGQTLIPEGIVTEKDDIRGFAKIKYELLGRYTETEAPYYDIEKI